MDREQEVVKRTVLEKLEESVFHFTCLIERLEYMIEVKDAEIERLEKLIGLGH